MAPTDCDQARASHSRLVASLARLSDDVARRPSRLPGWSIGHVLTHLARNADSHVRMLEAAGGGEVVDQYPGGNAQRAADIEAGSGRSAAVLAGDVAATAARLEAAWDATPEHAWRRGEGRFVVGARPLADLPFLRWREVEIHHVDLGLSYGFEDWPEDYVEAELARTLRGLAERLPAGAAVDVRATDTGEAWVVPTGATLAAKAVTSDTVVPQVVAGERRQLLAWLLGRGGGAGFPAPGPWTGR